MSEETRKIDPAMFEVVGSDAKAREAIARPSVSYFKDAMRRLFRNPTAVVCIVILLVIMLGAIFVPIFSPYTMEQQDVVNNYAGFMTRDANGGLHIFGTDELGRDVFVRVWSGARVSLTIAVAAVFVNFIIGCIYGCISGFYGGAVDNIMQRIVEIIIGIPYLIIVILMMVIMEPGMLTMIIAYATVGWTGMARLVRGQVMQLKENEYVLAARVMGAGVWRINLRHLLPNLLSVVIVNLTLAIPGAIFTESFLSFIGLGVPIPQASWGTLASDGIRAFQQHPHVLIVPAVFISLTMLSFNLLGDALRDAFDPRLRK
ncbi:MAG: ABC transporter permease [Eubacteriales bacterium]|nr:ABC transporter permease [Eubacteriales bacterium]